MPLNTNKRRKENTVKDTVTGVVGGVVVAMIHKGVFDDLKSNDAKREAITRAITEVGKAFD